MRTFLPKDSRFIFVLKTISFHRYKGPDPYCVSIIFACWKEEALVVNVESDIAKSSHFFSPQRSMT